MWFIYLNIQHNYAMLLLCYAMLCYAMLCYAMVCHAMLGYAMPCHAMLCYAMPCHAILCYAQLLPSARLLEYCTLKFCFIGSTGWISKSLCCCCWLLLYEWINWLNLNASVLIWINNWLNLNARWCESNFLSIFIMNVTLQFGEYEKFAVAQPTGNNMAGLPCWVLMTQFGEDVDNVVSDEEYKYRVECWLRSVAKMWQMCCLRRGI